MSPNLKTEYTKGGINDNQITSLLSRNVVQINGITSANDIGGATKC